MTSAAFYQQGIDCVKVGDRQGAMEAFNRAIAADPQLAAAYCRRARLHLEAGDTEIAIADYTAAIALETTADAYAGRALARLGLGSLQAAILDANLALGLAPQEKTAASLHQLIGTAYRQLHQPTDAIQAYKQATKLFLEQQDKQNAERCLKSIEAIKLAKQQQSLDTANKRSGLTVTNYLGLVTQKFAAGNYRSALDDCNWVLQVEPQNAIAYCHRGAILARLGQRQAALLDLARAMRLAPDCVETRLQRGIVRLELGDALGAIDDFTAVLSSTTENAEAYQQRGRAWHNLKDYRQAIEDYSRGLQLAENNTRLYQLRAEARLAFGDQAGALVDYQQATTLCLEQGHLAQYQQLLTKLRPLQAKVSDTRLKAAKQSANAPDTVDLALLQQLLQRVGGNRAIAERLINLARQKYPDMPEDWYIKKVLFDLEGEQQ